MESELKRGIRGVVERVRKGEAGFRTWGTLAIVGLPYGDAWLLDTEDALAIHLLYKGDRQKYQIGDQPGGLAIQWTHEFACFEDGVVIRCMKEEEESFRIFLDKPSTFITEGLRRSGLGVSRKPTVKSFRHVFTDVDPLIVPGAVEIEITNTGTRARIPIVAGGHFISWPEFGEAKTWE